MNFPDSQSPEEWATSISQMRRSYGEIGLPDGALPADPLEGIAAWVAQAASNPLIVEANAMVLSTVDHHGHAQARSVLLKGIDPRGLTFFTNYESNKGRDLQIHPQACVVFPWYPMERQLIVNGEVTKLSRNESEEYFYSRPWGHQIGALASKQSRPLASREELERRWQEAAERYPEAGTVPMPESWGGFLLRPRRVEFWQGRYSRLHDRIVFTMSDSDWTSTRLFP